jgi:hypothetical protein
MRSAECYFDSYDRVGCMSRSNIGFLTMGGDGSRRSSLTSVDASVSTRESCSDNRGHLTVLDETE